MMDDLISRQAAIDAVEKWFFDTTDLRQPKEVLCCLPSAQSNDWMERNKDRILQAGLEGREVEFRIGGRLFAIREKAQ